MSTLFARARKRSSSYHNCPNSEHAGQPTTMAPPNALEILSLMHSMHGCMQGSLQFRDRTTVSSKWRSAYCFINAEAGAFRYELKALESSEYGTSQRAIAFETLIPNLRSCTIHACYDSSIRREILRLTTAHGKHQFDLCPDSEIEFCKWFAALLSWKALRLDQNIKEYGAIYHCEPMQDPFCDELYGGPLRILSQDDGFSILRRDTISLLSVHRNGGSSNKHLVHVVQMETTCTLRVNGEFVLQDNDSSNTLVTLAIGQLPRHAIQRIDETVFDRALMLAIYPQYSRKISASSQIRPIYLSFLRQDLYETWLVLLRSCAIPEFFRADPADEASLLRISTSLKISNLKVDLTNVSHQYSMLDDREDISVRPIKDYHVETCIDEHPQARISLCSNSQGIFNSDKSFCFFDLPSDLTSMSIRLKEVVPGSGKNKSTAQRNTCTGPINTAQDHSVGVPPVYREEKLEMASLGCSQPEKKAVPILNTVGAQVGQATFVITHHRRYVLMEQEYYRMFKFLQDFPNYLTSIIYTVCKSQTIRLSRCFLDLFQATGQAEDWHRFLIDEEVNGKNLSSSTKNQASIKESQHILLFRSTNLLTRSLETYMRRFGSQYLKETLSTTLQAINDADEDCEVDPSRLSSSADMTERWQMLVAKAQNLWSRILGSAESCPKELCSIFRHIRDAVGNRYCDRIISYTSVSAIVFLRFFCPAITSPQTFGLLNNESGENAKRTFLLLAKALQGLASMTHFGDKEPWMAPMNDFCSNNRYHLQHYIDILCDAEEARNMLALPSGNTELKTFREKLRRQSDEEKTQVSFRSYQAAAQTQRNEPVNSYSSQTMNALVRRLVPTAREGYLTLPFLIDPACALAEISEIWCEQLTLLNPRSNGSLEQGETVEAFSQACLLVERKTRYLAQLINTSNLRKYGTFPAVKQQWWALAEQYESDPATFWEVNSRVEVAEGCETAEESRASGTESTKSRNGTFTRDSAQKNKAKSRGQTHAKSENALRKLGWI